MVARARKTDEDFADYRKALKKEAKQLKVRLSLLYAAAAPTSLLSQAKDKLMKAFSTIPTNLLPAKPTAKQRQKVRTDRKAQRLARRAQR